MVCGHSERLRQFSRGESVVLFTEALCPNRQVTGLDCRESGGHSTGSVLHDTVMLLNVYNPFTPPQYRRILIDKFFDI